MRQPTKRQQTNHVYVKFSEYFTLSSVFSRGPVHSSFLTNTRVSEANRTVYAIYCRLPGPKTYTKFRHAMSIYCALFKWRAAHRRRGARILYERYKSIYWNRRGWVFPFSFVQTLGTFFYFFYLSSWKKIRRFHNRNLSRPKSFLSDRV